MDNKSINLQDLVYLIIKADGTMFYILKNNKYSNHYFYINDIRKQDSYLMELSFGLTFSRDDNTSQIMFFKGLVEDSCIIFENQSLYSSDIKYAFDFYFPEKVTNVQKDILEAHMNEIEKAEFIFVEKYQFEMEKFVPLYNDLKDLKSSVILKQYLKTHLSVFSNIALK